VPDFAQEAANSASADTAVHRTSRV
jgi:hypothetical protein